MRATRLAGLAASLCALSGAFGAARIAHAQDALLPSTSWRVAPMFSMWSFGTPLAQPAGGLEGVQQFGASLAWRAVVGGRWTIDASGAFASSRAKFASGDSSRTLTLGGPTDIKVRVSTSLGGDRVLLTAGANLPTGTTGLDEDETSVLQVIGAPALQMPVGALGLGAGGTFGLAVAQQAGPWALAIGGSLEQRTEYTAVDIALTQGRALTKITPGTVMHFTVGADRAVGEHRLSMLFIGDLYGEDEVTLGDSGEEPTPSRYTLGPQLTALALVDLSRTGWRSATASVSVRHRAAFTDGDGAKVEGSSGNSLEASFFGVRGPAVGRGWVFGVDARYHTGFEFSDALVAAAASTAGLTLGIELPTDTRVLRLAVRGQFGTFDTGTTKSNGTGISLIGAFGGRRDAR